MRQAGGGRAGPGRCAAAATVAVLLTGTAAPGVAAAGPSTAPTPTPGTPVCQVRDSRLTEISGMAATSTGFVVVNDGADDESRRRVFFLDADCAVVRTVRYPSRPRDTEDLAIGADGTIWVGDIGDNDRSRTTIAVWKFPPGAGKPVLYRMAYPDRPHDAEAMLLTGDGRPLVVTKHSAELYAPANPLRAGATVPLVRMGQVRLPSTTTSNPFSFLGRSVVTGAATAPDRRRVLLRTYADAFEYDVPDGDVVTALTTGTPRVVPLPDEPQGESITYSRDGRSILTVSESTGQSPGTRPVVLRYAGTPTPTPVTPAGTPAATPSPSGDRAGPAPGHRGAGALSPAAVAVGLGLAGLALAGWVRSRRSVRR